MPRLKNMSERLITFHTRNPKNVYGCDDVRCTPGLWTECTHEQYAELSKSDLFRDLSEAALIQAADTTPPAPVVEAPKK